MVEERKEKVWTSLTPKDLENERLDQVNSMGRNHPQASWVKEIKDVGSDENFDCPDMQAPFQFKEMRLEEFQAYYGVPKTGSANEISFKIATPKPSPG